MRDIEDGDTGRRRFASGQFVPFDGMFTDIWGGGLPLLQGELFPLHPDMGESKWTYAGPLSHGLQQPAGLKATKRERKN